MNMNDDKNCICPICGKNLTVANFKKHYNACVNPNSKLNKNKNKVIQHITHDGLTCVYCGKECKNNNSLAQHEVRCKLNPNRKNYDSLSKYSVENIKGTTYETNPVVKKMVDTRNKNMASPNYVNPLSGSKRTISYINEDKNNQEIQKWIDFLNKNYDSVMLLKKIESTFTHGNTYGSVKNCYIQPYMRQPDNSCGRYIYQHNFSMSFILGEKLPDGSIVHHIDMCASNNDIYNLILFRSNADHLRYHTAKNALLHYDENTHMFSCDTGG